MLAGELTNAVCFKSPSNDYFLFGIAVVLIGEHHAVRIIPLYSLAYQELAGKV